MSPATAHRPIRILEHGVYRGPHLYSHRPMVRIQVDLGEMESWPTDRLPGFAEALVGALPTLDSHGCCYGEPGGFLRRLREGTWLGHVVEHVALELQALAGASTTRGKTRSVKGRAGVYNVMFAYEDEETGLLAGRLAFQIVDALLPPERRGVEGLETLAAGRADLAGIETVEAALPLLKASRRRGMFGPSTQALVDAARRRGVPVTRLNGQSLVQLGWGARQRRLRASVTDRTGLVASELAGDKAEAKALLAAIGCPVARGVVVRTADRAVIEAKGLKRPLVVKPLDGNHGRGVTTGLRTGEEIRAAFDLAVQHSRHVIVEEELPGRDHRILVVDGQVVAVAERVPAQVIGDGRSTISELVAEANADPRRGDGHENLLTRIRLDDQAAFDILERQGLTTDSVPAAGQVVALRTTANLSSGGVAIDRTDDIHPDNAAIARRAALAIGLDVAGIDLLAPDISRSVRETGGGIVEVNAAPGLRMHLAPSEGQPRDVAEPIIRMMFPRGSTARIPVLAVTGTNGKSTVGRMLAHVFRHTGRTVGLTNTSGVYINDERLHAGDASGPKSARMVLRDPTVEVAVLECARGGILREGLAFDRCDVGAVLNVQPDHLGLKGIDTLEDLAAVKSVVVESVSRRGVSVLNADDPLTLRMAKHAGGRVCWFSMRGGDDTPGFLLKHIGQGGLAVLHDPASGEISLHDGGAAVAVCNARAIPATLNGAALFNVQNALAAVGMAYGAGVEHAAIGAALSGFASTFEQNPGRLNVYDGHGFRVILDYAHNPEGLRALGRLVSAIRPASGRTIAMLSVPGDRREAEILAMGEVGAEYFDQLVFRETPDNRGRPAGEVIRLMTEGAAAAGCDPLRIRGYHREEDAVAACLDMARAGDLVILTPTRVEAVWRQMLDFRPAVTSDGAPADVVLEPPHG
ncbi:cyanophycin synthetase [Brevundimonas sp.]|uniref:cyanophycin synthetase n=1 Tax=Brevundimonas sp. TaxID=1871086 RepID=UPI002D6844DF|nr:cyanophycin synthetase [Brevundimonas sp.]HYD26501.1 cyanophycin synthetase [Brevundimonas sp.]